ncbi:hypothetical protein AAGS61_15035 [Lysinibacillus sp. KU-BSD001]|uniref:hypothetical protein n=1 Tax=Lysinibacillus sp. KU-BSD001 TaxID=3141328 RepID=UPI0036EC9236
MLKISIFLAAIFIISFLLLFWFVRHENKKEEKKDSLITLAIVSAIFSVIITSVFAFFLFIIIGSTSVIDKIFSLNLTTNQLLLIGISFLIYWLTIDNIFEKLFEYMLGENVFSILLLAFSRVMPFYIIGILLKLNEFINMTVSVGVPLILLVIDTLYYFKNNKLYINR